MDLLLRTKEMSSASAERRGNRLRSRRTECLAGSAHNDGGCFRGFAFRRVLLSEPPSPPSFHQPFRPIKLPADSVLGAALLDPRRFGCERSEKMPFQALLFIPNQWRGGNRISQTHSLSIGRKLVRLQAVNACHPCRRGGGSSAKLSSGGSGELPRIILDATTILVGDCEGAKRKAPAVRRERKRDYAGALRCYLVVRTPSQGLCSRYPCSLHTTQ